jgi:DNA polymerase III subunit alpha
MKSVNLHQHSEHSFLDGQAKIMALGRRSKSVDADTLVLTDHQECGGHADLHFVCQELDLKPVYGMEGYFYDGGAALARKNKIRVPDLSHITILAKNNQGLSDLWKWSSQAYIDGFYHRAMVGWDEMREMGRNVWASDGCLMSYMAKAIIDDKEDRQHELMARYLDTFGDNFFMELHTWQFMNLPDGPNTPMPVRTSNLSDKDWRETLARWDPQHERRVLNENMTKVNQRKVELANQYGVPLTVVNDNHYAEPEDWEKHALVWRMKTQDKSDQTDEGRTAAWLMSDDELYFWMDKHGIGADVVRQAIDNSRMIADSCNAEIQPELRFPSLTESEADDIRLFQRNNEEGFKRRVLDKGLDPELYRARMEHEERVIIDAKYPGYFNVVGDYIRWAKEEADMFIGHGRGSVGGSLVAYLQGITELDPLKYDLLFERFISDARKGFPDIDTDFPQSRLPEARAYMGRRYGEDHVCGIGTFSKSQPKAVLGDLCIALGIPMSDSKKMSKEIGKVPAHTSWDKFMSTKADKVAPWQAKYPSLFEWGEEMVGMTRHWGKHASGLIASPVPLMGLLPMRKGSKPGDEIVTQWDHRMVEWYGLLKMDFLGLRHCDTIGETVKLVERRHGVRLSPYDFGDREYADPDIWTSIAEGDNLGIFQIDADDMGRTAKRFKPQNEVDVAELLAVNRPGVINAGKREPYIDRKHGLEEVTFDHPLMEDITAETYGILIFQEQLMKMAQAAAGFTPQESDHLRSVVGKKQVDKLPALKEQFFDGCHANQAFLDACSGNPEKVIEGLWSSIEASGEYLFNKSHSLGYALIAATEVWLRHYYYEEFIAASIMTDRENMPKYVRHARSRGLEILPPDINQSDEDFTLTDDGIRYGLRAVSNVGVVAWKELSRARSERRFESLHDLLERTARKHVNKTVVTQLIRIGALDTLNPDRNALETQYYEWAKIKPENRPELPNFDDPIVGYQVEKAIVGSHIIYDPLRPYEDVLAKACLQSPAELEAVTKGRVVLVGGLVTRIHEIVTKKGKGDPMAFMTLTYLERDFEVIVFPEAWATSKYFLKVDVPVVCRVIKLEDDACHLSQVQRLDLLDD